MGAEGKNPQQAANDAAATQPSGTLAPSYWDQVIDTTSAFAAANGRDLNKDNSLAYWNAITGGPGNSTMRNINASATGTGQALMGDYGNALMRQAGADSESQRRAMEQRLSQGGMLGTDSGAGRTALAQAIAQPYAQAQTQLMGQQSQLAGNAYNQLMGGFGNQGQQQLIAPQFMVQEGNKQDAVNAQRASSGGNAAMK